MERDGLCRQCVSQKSALQIALQLAAFFSKTAQFTRHSVRKRGKQPASYTESSSGAGMTSHFRRRIGDPPR
jgi:hypothetical protein